MMKRIFQTRGKKPCSPSSDKKSHDDDRRHSSLMSCSSKTDMSIRQPLHLQLDHDTAIAQGSFPSLSYCPIQSSSNRVVSVTSSSYEKNDHQYHHSTTEWVECDDSLEENPTIAKEHDNKEPLANHAQYDIQTNSQCHTSMSISSTVSKNVSSALDYVLAEMEQQQGRNKDFVLSTTNHSEMLKRKGSSSTQDSNDSCTLQNHSIGIMKSVLSTGHKDTDDTILLKNNLDIESQVTCSNKKLTHAVSMVDEFPTKHNGQELFPSSPPNIQQHLSTPSLRIESSMLLPEDSLNYVAQMKLLEDDRNCLDKTIESNPSHTILVKEESGGDSTMYSSFNSSSKTTMRSISSSSPSSSSHGSSSAMGPSISRTIPMIAGTAAAAVQYNATKNHSSFKKSPFMILGPFLSNPMEQDVEEEEEDTTNHMNLLETGDDPKQDMDTHFQKITSNHNTVVSSKRSMGMDILADITSYAAPITVDDCKYMDTEKQQQDTETAKTMSRLSTTNHYDAFLSNEFAPIGQSLSIYAAIAAQAGIATCFNSLSSTGLEALHDFSTEKNHEEEWPSSSILPTHENAVVFDTQLPDSDYTRYVGKIRRFSADKRCYGDWIDLPYHSLRVTTPRRWHDLNIDESIEIPLAKGGRLRIFPNFLAESRRRLLVHILNTSSLLHQEGSNHSDQASSESHTRISLSSNLLINNDDGYQLSAEEGRDDAKAKISPAYLYQREKNTRKLAISTIPGIGEIATDLADLYSLPRRDWNNGVDAIVYNNKNDYVDRISEYSQDEILTLYTFIEGAYDSHQVIFKPKNSVGILEEGNEEIVLFLCQGDAFEIVGPIQTSYEYSLHVKGDCSGCLSLLTFRHGETYHSNDGSGSGDIQISGENSYAGGNILSTHPLTNLFGHPRSDVSEGKGLFYRDVLRDAYAHNDDQRNICGSIRDGCYSLLVENLNQELREEDGLCWIQLTCSRGEGGGALCKSYQRKLPIRVFRSSSLESIYAPRAKDHEREVFRYDGLYCVRAMWDSTGNETEDYPTTDGGLHTFFLIRLQKKPLDVPIEHGLYFNLLSLQELWSLIQKLRGVRSPLKFEIPQPRMKLPPLPQENNEHCRYSTHISKKKIRVSKKKNCSADKGFIPCPSTESIITAKQKFKRKYTSNQNYASTVERETHLTNIKSTCNSDENSILTLMDKYRETSSENRNNGDSVSGNPIEVLPTPTQDSLDMSSDRDHEKVEVLEDSIQNSKKNLSKSIPPDIHEGSRVSIEYKGILYKASVQRCRLKEDEWQYLVHYDGHKKTNLRWIPRSLIQCIESDGQYTSKDTDLSLQKAKALCINETIMNDTVQQMPKKRGRKKKHVDERGTCEDSLKHATINTEHSKRKVKRFRRDREPFEAQSDEAISDSKKAINQDTTTLKCTKSDKSIHSGNYAVDTEVYVEYKGVLYLSNILDTRVVREQFEYLVHYDGYKKTADEWVSENMIHPMKPSFVKRFSAQRKDGKRKRSLKLDAAGSSFETHTEASQTSKKQKRCHEESSRKKLENAGVSPGVEFLPGSCVFVELENKVYLGKMAKRRKSGDELEYLVIFDDDSLHTSSQRWIPLSMIYEINPRTRRVYESTRSNIGPIDINLKSDKNEKKINISNNSSSEPKPPSDLREDKTTKKVKVKSEPSWNTNVSSGVDFLPGSTLFVRRCKDGLLYLAKMLKKRGKGEDQEYFVHYEGQKNDEGWVSINWVYEINPQTKRIFKNQAK